MSHSTPRGPRRGVRGAVDAAGHAVALTLAGVARARGGKAVHPHGATYAARLLVEGASAAPAGSELLSTPAEWPVIVRFSRSLGLPRPLPDLLGMSIRVPDAYGPAQHQDLLFVTSVDAPILHHIFLPARDVWERPYSSSLPYRAGGEAFLIGARPDPELPQFRGGTELERLERAVRAESVRFDLVVAPVLGRFRRIGSLRIEAPMPDVLDALRFNPANTGGGLEPVGTLNRWRAVAYPLSQRAWASASHRAAEAQRVADEEVRAFAARPGKLKAKPSTARIEAGKSST